MHDEELLIVAPIVEAPIGPADRRVRHGLVIVGAVMVALVVVSAIVTVYRATRPTPFNPLYGPTSGQHVAAQTGTYIDVTGQKCNRDTYPVWIRGNSYAQPVLPRGLTIRLGEGETVRITGCTALKFRNVYPSPVLDYTAQAKTPVVWRFFGIETPVGRCAGPGRKIPAHIKKTQVVETADGTFNCWAVGHGVNWRWTTENFQIPPDKPKKKDKP